MPVPPPPPAANAKLGIKVIATVAKDLSFIASSEFVWGIGRETPDNVPPEEMFLVMVPGSQNPSRLTEARKSLIFTKSLFEFPSKERHKDVKGWNYRLKDACNGDEGGPPPALSGAQRA
jgi:hypothetical protein